MGIAKHRCVRNPPQCCLSWGLKGTSAESVLVEPECKASGAKMNLMFNLLANWWWLSTPEKPKIINVQPAPIALIRAGCQFISVGIASREQSPAAHSSPIFVVSL